MTHLLSITDGAGTVTLASSDKYIVEYIPQVASDLSQPVRESAKIRFTTSISTIQSNLQALNRLFDQAANYTRNRSGPKVYVNFQPDTTTGVYRSLLYGGAAQPSDDILKWEWREKNVSFDVSWTRDPFWEGTITPVPLTNGNGTLTTSGLTVDNCSGTATYNYATIAAANLTGDMPAPFKVEMVNATNGADDSDEVYIFHNVYSTPSAFSHIIEAETGGTALVTSTASGTASAGAYGAMTWSGTSTTKIAEWTLSSSDMSKASGGRFAILARWGDGLFPYGDCWLRFQLESTSGQFVIWRGNFTLPSTLPDGRQLTLLDTLRLPPYLQGQTTIRELILALYGKRNDTSHTLNLDYIQLSPVSGDSGWLRFKAITNGVAYTLSFVHDAIEGITYRTDGSSNFISDFTQYGGPIMLVPGQDQRLYFLTSDYLGYAKPSQQWTVKLWYRPRRSSI